MTNRHWLEGLIANTCAERSALPGYGAGELGELGWLGLERKRWRETLGIEEEKLSFFKMPRRGRRGALRHRLERGREVRDRPWYGGRRGRSLPDKPAGLGELLERYLCRRRLARAG